MRSALMKGSMVGALSLLPVATGIGIFEKRALSDPVARYLSGICSPSFTNATWWRQSSDDQLFVQLAESPYPCEQVLYIQAACRANGTEEIDFLAEQQCLCPSSLWTLAEACNQCYLVHGYQEETLPEAKSELTRISAALCTPSPPYQPFTSLFSTVDFESLWDTPPLTLGKDLFPNNTAVSNYFTPTGTAGISLGEITGSATGSATGRVASWTGPNGEVDVNSGVKTATASTPTTTGTITSSERSSETSSTGEVRGQTSNTSVSAASTPTSSNAAVAATGGVNGYGCLLAAGLGAVALL